MRAIISLAAAFSLLMIGMIGVQLQSNAAREKAHVEAIASRDALSKRIDAYEQHDAIELAKIEGMLGARK